MWRDILNEEVDSFLNSQKRRDMLNGERYYRGEQDILKRKKTVIGPGGVVEECKHLLNSRVVDNQYARVVDQKVSYLLGKPLTLMTEKQDFLPELQHFFGADFRRKFRMIGEDALNCGIGWLHPYYNQKGQLKLRRIAPWEMIPIWKDDSHSELESAIRVYAMEQSGNRPPKIQVELFTPEGLFCFSRDEGLFCFSRDEGVFTLDSGVKPYFTCKSKSKEIPGFWGAVPLIAFRAGFREIPLINRVKSLQDGINTMLSDFQDRLGEDTHHTVLVIRNFDGEDLGEFRRNLATFGAVKVRSEGGDGGGVETLNIAVNAQNFEAILHTLKKALVENAKGFDVRDLQHMGSPNQMAIQSMYADMDLDAQGMEIEFTAGIEELLFFFAAHLERVGKGGLLPQDVDVIFNKDMLINEGETIENCVRSLEILSKESVLYQHPWTKDAEKEMGRLREEMLLARAKEVENGGILEGILQTMGDMVEYAQE